MAARGFCIRFLGRSFAPLVPVRRTLMATCSVLGDVTLEPWIHWHKDEGLFIPNVVEFVKRVLCIHFPGMKGVRIHSSSPN